MSVIKDAYLELAPHGSRLADVVVLSQAWKKSHAFMRRHNWYADVLELDASTVDLEDKLLRWCADVSKKNFCPRELFLVPAPKIAKWEFRSTPGEPSPEAPRDLGIDSPDSNKPTFEDWAPKKEPGSDAASSNLTQKLRPLAHLSIRDQTLATAVMMCLAEAVETAQGDTSGKDVLMMRKRGVVSYGNRLQCNWVEQPNVPSCAKFSWGNSRTYRQYFQDYRAFLARPRRVCAELLTQLPPGRELFVVSLDIKSFFDRVDVAALLQELCRIEVEHRQTFGLPDRSAADKVFWQRAKRIFRWQWCSGDHKQAELMCEGGQKKLELGLPQGLVASGFLANAYLLQLDSDLRSAASVGSDVKLLDYCRYVDDMRMVVEAPSGTGQKAILEQVSAFVTKALEKHCAQLKAKKVLELSRDKCVVTPYSSISAQSNLSVLMDVLNAELSGTFDLESLAQAAGGLDGLLWMADQIDVAEEPKPSRLRLATVAAPSTDVRDDTVKRFVATRLAQLLRHRLAMTNAAAYTSTGNVLSDRVTNGMALAHEFESTARKLIKCWAENPSLVLLLRCGLDLFPHPRLLSPVAEALSVKLFCPLGDLKTTQLRQVRVAEYVLADLLRAGAVETGFRAEEDYPESVDIAGYREDLGTLARRVILERADSPWYLLQQAHLYLSSVGDVSLAVTGESSCALVQPYKMLNRAIMFEPAHSKALKEVLPLALVAQQLHPNPRRFGVWLAEGLRLTKNDAMQKEVVTTVSLHRPDLMLAALNGRGSRAPRWRNFVPSALIETNKRTFSRRTGGARRNVLLHHVMMEADNVFAQENGVLMLAKALLGVKDIEEHLRSGLSPMDITLDCGDWTRVHALPDEKDFLVVVQPLVRTESASPLYGNPPWVDDDSAWLYGLGRILRAALTGEFDFTSRRYLVTEEVGHYTGLRSSWFRRRFGLMNSGRGLLDEPGPVSPWLSGLLSTLLRWPGIEFRAHHVAAARTANELLAIFEERIAVQRALFGTRSKTPMYVVPTDDHASLQDRPLRVAIVQPIRPRKDEFDVKDPTHWTPGVLAEHRGHLAEICRLTFQKLRTWASAQSSKSTDEERDGPVVDVILFPELAVHPEHVFLLRRLSDKLGANIFTGLTFQASAKLGAPINQGLWVIRTESPGHGRSIQYVWQGKLHPTKLERTMGVKGYRPHLTLVELPVGSKTRTRIAAAICYDATDLDLVADLRDQSDVFLVAALNQDVQTFDNMVAALHFHMYQPVVLANSGEFGGSTAQVPLPKHERLIAHVHGNNQVAVSVFEVDPAPFKSTNLAKAPKELKAAPAGYRGRPS
ncbi:reverse transcriptase [Verminephrobacter aporrectodeae subsp. tuberculatae]|uniref:reverse transcriptase domain-containing protein n=1 Tax=Verminephrobacter aporrectodeae TaxID=1110389 RepID=UPI002242FC08|nr:reverse transcriptase domain-containing protein [Verminephrobacter aporrectodeae]MCW8165740.1 reverse transcriptase [Verminephrobacter aporrectodeae subsp. tuberculatae]MCW8169753.1 reverse transcriptase [Verminephrobacter aporrectodeae subsp. tuberculatae]